MFAEGCTSAITDGIAKRSRDRFGSDHGSGDIAVFPYLESTYREGADAERSRGGRKSTYSPSKKKRKLRNFLGAAAESFHFSGHTVTGQGLRQF